MRPRLWFILALMWVLVLVGVQPAAAEPLPGLNISIAPAQGAEGAVSTLNLLLLLTVLALAPAILVMMTSFTRIVVVLAFVRSAMGTQQTPPNQILIGLALFLTFFTMYPVGQEIYSGAVQPYMAGQITRQQALEIGAGPLRAFMARQTREKDLALFVNISKMEPPRTRDDIPLRVLIPAFIISELKTAFQMGFLLYVPFLIVDLVVSSTLMAMGMFMVPPIMISLPFKILLFVLVDGWYLVVKSLLQSFG